MYTVTFSGTFLSSATGSIAADMQREIIKRGTAETEKRVRVLGQSLFRYATKTHNVPGKWRSSIHSEFSGTEGIVSTDIIYGPWLEGVGSRNASTRFKGYFMWRRTAQAMDRSGMLEVARPIVDRAVRELNR